MDFFSPEKNQASLENPESLITARPSLSDEPAKTDVIRAALALAQAAERPAREVLSKSVFRVIGLSITALTLRFGKEEITFVLKSSKFSPMLLLAKEQKASSPKCIPAAEIVPCSRSLKPVRHFH